MNKFLFLILYVFILLFVKTNSVSAQTYCPPENACLCGGGTYPACCEIEGPGGYNCGGDGGTSTPAPGGSGSECRPGVNCPANYTPAWNQPLYSDWCDQGSPRTCSLGSAQAEGECCTANCGRRIVTTFACCPQGTSDQCVIEDTGNTYNVTNSCFTPTSCGAYDVYVSHVDAPNTPANLCATGCNNCGQEDEEKVKFYNKITTCRDFTRTCTCTPTCTVTDPSTPTLLSPEDNSIVYTNNVSLIWDNSTQNWGDSCVPDSNEFEVYIGTNPASLALIGTVGTGTGSASFEGNTGVTYYWKVRAKNGSANTDSSVWSFTINEGPWWQVKDGDVTTNGVLSSSVPDLEVFSDIGSGGSHGVPVYGTSFNLYLDTPERISLNIWNANTTTTQSRIFNYSYFSNLIPEDIQFNNIIEIETGGILTDINGYEWYKVTGHYNTSGDINVGNRRVVLFVEQGNLNIAGKINLDDGIGFFGAFVDGNITIDQAVNGAPAIEGIYMADNNISTGAGDSQLHLRGSIASYGAVSLQRDLIDNSQPAELFEFAPDQMMLFPNQLQFKRAKWAEVAP